MAHFAELDKNNVVLTVVVVDNFRLGDDPELEETNGINYLHEVLGDGRRWAQTSFNGNFRKQYAGIGFTYDAVNDVFIAPQPYPSWTLNDTFDWVAPVPCPNPTYVWDEQNQIWVEPNE